MHLIGCECETVIPEGAARVGEYHAGRIVLFLDGHLQVVADGHGDSSRTGRWTAEGDSSIQPEEGEMGAELVSPLFELNSRSMQSMCEGLLEWRTSTDARTNPSCGTHISVSTSREWDSTDLATAIAIASLIEPAVAAATGSNRRIGRNYAEKIPADGHQRGKPRHANICGANTRGMARESWLNVMNVQGGRIRSSENARIEFRAWTGTTNPSRLFAWAVLSAAIVGAMEERRAICLPHELFDHTTAFGTGEQALRALFVTLGWSHRSGVGRNSPRPARDTDSAAGWRHVADVVDRDIAGRSRTLSTTMQTLIELARRHDARLGGE